MITKKTVQLLMRISLLVTLFGWKPTFAACETEFQAVLAMLKNQKPPASDTEWQKTQSNFLKGSYVSDITLSNVDANIKEHKQRINSATEAASRNLEFAFLVQREWQRCALLNPSGRSNSAVQPQNESSGKTSAPTTVTNNAQQPVQQNQSTQQQSQQAQQQAQQPQEAARVAQTRADQARQGQRRRHEPENEASHCIQPDFGGLFGGMKNTCDFKVWYTYCGYRPKESSWLTGMSCEKQSFGSDSVSPGRTSASHTKGVESIHWIACKEPAWTVDTEFVPGQGIKGRCHTVGGK